MKVPANVAILLEKCLPGNSHLFLGQNLEEFSFTEGFTLGGNKIISSSVASGTTVSPLLTAKWSKVNYCATAVTCDNSRGTYLA